MSLDTEAQKTVLNTIDMVDTKFSTWRVPTLWIWAAAMFAPAILAFLLAIVLSNDLSSHNGTITTGDTALLALIVAMLSLVVSMLSNVIIKENTRWTVGANFGRLAKKDPNPILYGLISMKAQAPKVKLSAAYNANPELFNPASLLKRAYRESEP